MKDEFLAAISKKIYLLDEMKEQLWEKYQLLKLNFFQYYLCITGSVGIGKTTLASEFIKATKKIPIIIPINELENKLNLCNDNKFDEQFISKIIDEHHLISFITTEKINKNFDISETNSDGTCFFDAFAQGLKAININLSSHQLIKISQEYFHQHLLKQTSWLKQELLLNLKQEQLIVPYMKNFIITGYENMAGITRKRWGEPNIDGRILCEYIAKNYQEVELVSWENQQSNLNESAIYSGFLITKHGYQHCFNQITANLLNNNRIFIINKGQNHFQACIVKKEITNNQLLTFETKKEITDFTFIINDIDKIQNVNKLIKFLSHVTNENIIFTTSNWKKVAALKSLASIIFAININDYSLAAKLAMLKTYIVPQLLIKNQCSNTLVFNDKVIEKMIPKANEENSASIKLLKQNAATIIQQLLVTTNNEKENIGFPLITNSNDWSLKINILNYNYYISKLAKTETLIINNINNIDRLFINIYQNYKTVKIKDQLEILYYQKILTNVGYKNIKSLLTYLEQQVADKVIIFINMSQSLKIDFMILKDLIITMLREGKYFPLLVTETKNNTLSAIKQKRKSLLKFAGKVINDYGLKEQYQKKYTDVKTSEKKEYSLRLISKEKKIKETNDYGLTEQYQKKYTDVNSQKKEYSLRLISKENKTKEDNDLQLSLYNIMQIDEAKVANFTTITTTKEITEDVETTITKKWGRQQFQKALSEKYIINCIISALNNLKVKSENNPEIWANFIDEDNFVGYNSLPISLLVSDKIWINILYYDIEVIDILINHYYFPLPLLLNHIKKTLIQIVKINNNCQTEDINTQQKIQFLAIRLYDIYVKNWQYKIWTQQMEKLSLKISKYYQKQINNKQYYSRKIKNINYAELATDFIKRQEIIKLFCRLDTNKQEPALPPNDIEVEAKTAITSLSITSELTTNEPKNRPPVFNAIELTDINPKWEKKVNLSIEWKEMSKKFQEELVNINEKGKQLAKNKKLIII